MSDYIRREDALKEIDEWIMAFEDAVHKQSQADARLIRKGIVNLPPADVVQVRHGRWIHYRCDMYECSVCQHIYTSFDSERCDADYCPHCGSFNGGKNEV